MYPLLIALAFFGAAPVASPVPTCAAADVSLSNLRIKTIAESGKPDHIIVTATITNVGQHDQAADVKQYVVLLRNRIVVGKQRVPALPSAGATDIAFTIDRPREERGLPLPLGLQLRPTDASRNDCSRANDSIEKTF